MCYYYVNITKLIRHVRGGNPATGSRGQVFLSIPDFKGNIPFDIGKAF